MDSEPVNVEQEREPERTGQPAAKSAARRSRVKSPRYPGGPRRPGDRVFRGAGMDPRLKIKLWEDYFKGEARSEIAAKHQISQSSLEQLMTRERWPDRRRALEKEMFDNWHLTIQRLQHRHVVKVLQRQLGHAEQLGEKLLTLLKGALDPKSFVSLAQAFKAYEDVASRAVGLDRMTALDRQEQPAGKRSGPICWDLTVSDPGDAPAQPLIGDAVEARALIGNGLSSPQEPAQLSSRLL